MLEIQGTEVSEPTIAISIIEAIIIRIMDLIAITLSIAIIQFNVMNARVMVMCAPIVAIIYSNRATVIIKIDKTVRRPKMCKLTQVLTMSILVNSDEQVQTNATYVQANITLNSSVSHIKSLIEIDVQVNGQNFSALGGQWR